MSAAQRILRLEVEVAAMGSLLKKIAQANGIRQDGGGTGVSGVIQNHPHQATGEGGDIAYLPAVYADWRNSEPPGGLQGALDQLAERVQDLDTLTVPAVTMMMFGMEE